MSPGNGHVLAGTPIAVDFWSLRRCPASVKLFFLTHMHTDHTVDLTPSFNYPIYCTPLTKKLLLHKFQFTRDDIVQELEENENHVIRYGNNETVTVTPVDANHCPGAAMFLFEGSFGRILYTGDFRYSGPMQNDINLHILCRATVDVLYIDNTFCDPRCIFPSREDAVVEILRVIRSHPDARIKIGLRNLGKEEMLVAVARGISEWIGVTQERLHILELLSMANVFKVSSSCRIQVVMMSEITARRMEDWNVEQQTVAVIPTALGIALPWSAFPHREDVYVIPYSNHSSYKELQQFVSLIEPRKMCPILGRDLKDRLSRSLPNRHDVSCFQVAVDDGDQVCKERNSLSLYMSSEPQASASSSYSTSMDESALETTRSRTRKMYKQKRTFPFRKKTQMGVVFSPSQSPAKCSKGETVVTAADSAGVIAEEGSLCLDPTATVCDTTSNRSVEEDQDHIRSDKDPPYSDHQDRNPRDLDSLDNAWMLHVIKPLIVEEAYTIISEQHFSRRAFRRYSTNI